MQYSQYLLHIVKFNNVFCCGTKRTKFSDVFPKRYVPCPIPYHNTESGNVCSEIGTGHFGSLFQTLTLQLEPSHGLKEMPFDFYCPSVVDALHKQVCSKFGKYFQSNAAVKEHIKTVHCDTDSL